MLSVTLLAISCLIGSSTSSGSLDFNVDCARVVSESSAELVLSFVPSPADISTVTIEGKEFTHITTMGESRIGKIGMPDLPAVARTVIVPPNTILSVEIINDNITLLDAPLPPKPFTGDEESPVSASLKSFDGIFPPEPVVLGSPTSFRGWRLVNVTFHPYQYDPAASKFIYHEDIEVALEFHPLEDDSADEQRPVTLTRDSYRFLRALTLNPPQRDDDGANLPRGGYLIVAGNGFGDAEEDINRLADWKRACGHYVEVEMGETNYSSIMDDFVEPAYEEWDPPLEYVCLIGAWGNPSAQGTYGDVYYGFLDGRDHISEVAVGRLSASGRNQAQTVIRRALSYQADPYTGNDMDWFNRAGSMALRVDDWTVAVNFNMHWVAEAERRAGFEEVWTWYTGEDNDDGDLYRWIQNRVGIVFHRGRPNGGNFQAGNVFPIIITAGGGHVLNYWPPMWNQGSPDRLQGPSVISGSQHNQETFSCNTLVAGMARALLVDKLPVGWARAFALALLDYGGNAGRFGFDFYACREFNMFGEPGQLAWLGIPKEIEVHHPELISPGTNRIDVSVELPDNGNAVANALVTLTQPGELLFWATTDEEGECTLPIDPDLEDDVKITVTCDGILPYAAEIEVEVQPVNLTVSEARIDDEDGGNGDGILNPGETVNLYITIRNSGDSQAAREITGVINSKSGWIGFENREFELGDIEADREVEIETPLVMSLDASAPGDAELGLFVDLQSGGDCWRSNISVEQEGSHLQLARIISGDVIEEGLSELILSLNNVGETSSPPMSSRLVSGSWEIRVIDDDSEFGSVRPGGDDSVTVRSMRINLSTFTIGGLQVPMQLLLSAEVDDKPDTIHFNLQIMTPGDGNPIGPDTYGYFCFDDTDTEWQQCPEYEWIEISPRERDRVYDGEPLEGNRSTDFAHEMALPFTFTYYGEEFDEITVSENGFIAMGGDLEDLRGYDNYPLDRGMAGSFGMLAPYWDDLRVSGDERDILTYYAEDEGIFIVEYYNVSISGGGSGLTFEIILYDPEEYCTVTGDGIILFQYNEVPEPRQGLAPYYFSAGISCPGGENGMNYTSENEYPIGAAEIENRRTLLFATAAQYQPGILYGHVTDARTHEPVEGAVVFTGYSHSAVTNDEGYWRIEPVPADVNFEITAAISGYNDSTLTDLVVDVDDSLEIDFDLLHPEFRPSTMFFETTMDSGITEIIPFSVTNTGNGPLDWSLVRRLPGEADAAPWEYRHAYAVSDTVNDSRIEGVVYIDGRFYVAGANIMGQEDNTDMIYILDHDGTYIDCFEQPGEGNYGMRDLAWDGELIWGSGESSIIGFTRDGEVIHSFEGPYSNHNILAWDPDREVLWVARKTGNTIHAFDIEGNENEDLQLDQMGLRIYGLAYWFDDPDEYPLYILHSPDNRIWVVCKVNPDDGDMIGLLELEPDEGGAPGGAFITNQYDIYSWVFINTANHPDGDRLDVWQLDARREWFRVFSGEDDERTEVEAGLINAEEVQEFELQLSTDDLPSVLFQGMLYFYHNAEGEETVLDVDLHVINEPVPPTPFSLLSPEDGDTLDSVEDTLVTFAWEESYDYNQDDEVVYRLSVETDVATVCLWNEGNTFTIPVAALLDSLNASDATTFGMTWWVDAVSGEDIVECEQRFNLLYYGDSDIKESDIIPLEFGFQSIYPSPFNSTTTIRFGMVKDERVLLKIYDLTGREVTTLLNKQINRGNHQVIWDATGLSSGIYLLHLNAADRSENAKVILIR